jgi:DNA-binding NtrC family response regulator
MPTLLVVDDDEVLGQILVRLLQRQGYRVALAASASQAIRLAAEMQPNLALVDLCLPDGSGVQLGKELRREYPELQLILMTAFPVELREHQEWREWFERMLTKPLDLTDLRAAIAECLYHRARFGQTNPMHERGPLAGASG